MDPNINFMNFWHIAILLLTVAFAVAAHFIFRNKSERVKRIFILALSIFNVLIYVFRMIRLWDEEWFNIWNDLPLHLCGMSVIIFPLAILIKHDVIKNFCYFVSSAGGAMALIIPTVHFLGSPVYDIDNISFYAQHAIIATYGILLASLKLFRPSIKGAVHSTLMLGGCAVLCHGVNLLITHIGLGEPNYMFTVDASVNALLAAAYKVIPVDLLYLVLMIPILLFICALLYTPYLIKDIKAKKIQ